MAIYKIKTLNNISDKGLNLFDDDFIFGPDIEEPDAILVRSAKMHDYNFSKNTRMVARAGSGTNNIPIEKCSELGIIVCNSPGANANAVKEEVLFALLLGTRKFLEGMGWVKNIQSDEIEKEVEAGKKAFVGSELRGKKLGVIGLGAVGQLVSEMGVSLGMDVYGYDPFITLRGALRIDTNVTYLEKLEDLMKICDFITVHVPYNEGTKNIINKELLDLAKPQMTLINLARGGLVDLDALKEKLEKDQINKYICDFPSRETLAMKNTINIPHLGASSPESEENSASMAVRQMMDYLKNGNIKNSVNYPDSDMGICKSIHRITVAHKNIPNMLGQITNIIAEEEINISNLINNHRNGWAYTMIDIDSEVKESLRHKLNAIDGVTRVRLIK